MRSFAILVGALLPATASAGNILYCNDYNLGTDQMAVALAASGHTVTTQTDITACDTQIASGGWDLVILAIQNNSWTTPNFNAWATAGNPTIFQDWTRDATRGAAVGVTYTGTTNQTSVTVTHSALSAGVSPNPFTLTNPGSGWGVFAMSMSPATGSTTAGTFPSGSAVILARSDKVIVNGFLTDTGGAPAAQLYANEIDFLLKTCVDADGDGHDSDACGGDDCDDGNIAVHPGATEVCNGIDDDCEGGVDEGVTSTFYRDADTDGYGNASLPTSGCTAPSGYVADATDCDDTRDSVHPFATEVCNGIDDDCEGGIDEGVTTTYYRDADGDTYGNPAATIADCTVPSGYVADATDCDDTLDTVHPGATEVCNGDDDDCDLAVDEDDAADALTWYRDADSDTYGNASSSTKACSRPSGYVADATDCDDTRDSVHPLATEVCNGIDDDCDLVVDDGVTTTYYADSDGDGYGDASVTEAECSPSSGYVADSTDCDDTDDATWPGAPEVAYDGVDQDCDGADLVDVDGDGYDADVVGGDDCHDEDPDVHPGVAEAADGVDEDCDGTVDEGTDWYDDDGDGFTEEGGDCDDDDEYVSPAAIEACNTVDDDCDAVIDEDTDCADDDGDGFAETDGDCNDADADVSPGATETGGNGVDDDCDGSVDGGTFDADGDGYTVDGGDCDDDDASVYPGAPEDADGVDDDCDEVADEGTGAFDDDGDGYTEDDGDCNDDDDATNPDEGDAANGFDDDCDGDVDEGTDRFDDDGDGFTEEGGDCDDADADVNPAADELEDGADNDCDGDVDDGIGDEDGDGFTVEDGDCNDYNGWVNPALAEICDNDDNDCDGEVDEGDVCGGGDVVDTDPGKCGCSTPAHGVPALLPLLIGLLARRRRWSA